MKKALLVIVTAACIFLYIKMGYKYLFAVADTSKETVELNKLKRFGEIFFKNIKTNDVSSIKINPLFSRKELQGLAYFQDLNTNKKSLWLVLKLTKNNTTDFILASPQSYYVRGKERRLIMYSDGSAKIIENAEYLNLSKHAALVRLE